MTILLKITDLSQCHKNLSFRNSLFALKVSYIGLISTFLSRFRYAIEPISILAGLYAKVPFEIISDLLLSATETIPPFLNCSL